MRRLAIGFILLFSAAHFSWAQEIAGDSKTKEPLASKQLDDVRIRGYGVAELLSDLSLWYDIPIGLEVAINSGGFAKLVMNFKKATLGEVLNQFVTEQTEYAWEIRNGVVNVFPKEGHQDPIVKQVLDSEIGTFSIKEKTVTWDVERALLATPELSAVMKSQGLTKAAFDTSGFYFPHVGRNFKLDVSNMTVRAILDNIVKESKTAKFWWISRNSSEHTLSIRMSAWQDDAPRVMRRADFEDQEETLDIIPHPPNP